MHYTLHQTFPDHAGFSRDWNDLLSGSIANVPFLRHEYLSAWWENRGGGEWPEAARLAIVTAEKEGRLAGIAPLFWTESREGNPSLLLLGSIEISDYLDLIVPRAELAEFLNGLLNFLSAAGLGKYDLNWHNLLETSPSLAVLQSEAGRRGWSCAIHRTYHAPSIPLTGDFDTYLAGIDKKQRHEIRRKMRRAEESGAVNWYVVKDAASLESEADAFFDLMADDPAKAAFLTRRMRAQMHATIQAAFTAGWLQLAFLTVNGQKAAGYLDFDYGGHIWVYNSGIDRRFMEYSPGWVLLSYLLRWANENKRSEFDFMRGTEEYKYRFGGMDKYLVQAKVEQSP